MIQKLTTEYIERTVDLHQKVLGHTFNSQIGSWFLGKLYGVIEKSVGNGSCYIYVEGNEVSGFISFCLNHAKIEEEIMKSLSLAEKIKIGFFLLLKPQLIPPFLRQQLFGMYLKKNFTQPYVSILTLGVSPKTQGQGIGRQLVDKSKEIISGKDVKEFFVDTEETNNRAVQFYQKNGFRIVGIKHGNVILEYYF